MKDPLDFVTAELPLKQVARRGRPPVGERAMSPAERQRAYRRRSREKTLKLDPDQMTRPQLLDRLRFWMEQHDKAVCFETVTADENRAKRDCELAQGALRELVDEVRRRFAL